MDAVKFLIECHNYCDDCRAKAGKEWSTENCFSCELNHNIFDFQQKGAETMVKRIERLIEEKKSKTRQSEFLKQHPNASVERGVLELCPALVDQTISCKPTELSCWECRKINWLAPIEEATNKEIN